MEMMFWLLYSISLLLLIVATAFGSSKILRRGKGLRDQQNNMHASRPVEVPAGEQEKGESNAYLLYHLAPLVGEQNAPIWNMNQYTLYFDRNLRGLFTESVSIALGAECTVGTMSYGAK